MAATDSSCSAGTNHGTVLLLKAISPAEGIDPAIINTAFFKEGSELNFEILAADLLLRDSLKSPADIASAEQIFEVRILQSIIIPPREIREIEGAVQAGKKRLEVGRNLSFGHSSCSLMGKRLPDHVGKIIKIFYDRTCHGLTLLIALVL